jgi:hypothetical protein
MKNIALYIHLFKCPVILHLFLKTNSFNLHCFLFTTVDFLIFLNIKEILDPLVDLLVLNSLILFFCNYLFLLFWKDILTCYKILGGYFKNVIMLPFGIWGFHDMFS